MTPAVKLLSPFAAAALLFGAMPDSVLAAPPATTRVCKTHTHDGQGEHINIGEARNKAHLAWRNAVVQHDGPSWAGAWIVTAQSCVKTGKYEYSRPVYRCFLTARPCRSVRTPTQQTMPMPQ